MCYIIIGKTYPYVISSAINKAGREEILEYIYKLNKEIRITPK